MSSRNIPPRKAPKKLPPRKRRKKGKLKSHNEPMRRVAEDIIMMEFKNSDTVGALKRMFYSVVRKHGIRQGDRTGNARVISNFEWTMAKQLFVSRVTDHLNRIGIFEDIPKDLEAYREE